MAAKPAQTPRPEKHKPSDDEEPITERMGSQSAAVEADGDPMTADPDDDDPITERRLQPNPALDNPSGASHTKDDPVTRERVAEDSGGRGSDTQGSAVGNDDPVTRERVAEDAGGRGSD
jgi:hypothetical protein